MPRPHWSDVAKRMSDLATYRDHEWCGMPMPLPGLGLVLETKHPMAAKLAAIQEIVDGDAPPKAIECRTDDLGWTIVNQWNCPSRGGTVLVLRHEDGRRDHMLEPWAPTRNRLLFGPIETLDAWNLDTECTAIDTLADLLSERMFKAYALTGSFLETSKRSKIVYMFRRCRPTIAITPRGENGNMRLLCALCLHPIGYYQNSFAGAMSPTDDVIAHLLLVRSDEHLFWRRANQHRPIRPESGL